MAQTASTIIDRNGIAHKATPLLRPKIEGARMSKAIDYKAGSVKSLAKAMAIVDAIAEAGRPMRVAELSRSLDLSTSIVSRMIGTLVEGGWLEKEQATGYFIPGPRLLVQGMSSLGRRQLDLVALPILIGLSSHMNNYVSLGTMYDGQIILVRAGTMVNWQFKRFMTHILPFHAVATGKLLASALPWEEVEQMIGRRGMDIYTPNTVSTLEAFKQQLETISELGYAIEEGEILPGYRHFAAPIYDSDEKMIAAISSGGPTDKLDENEFKFQSSQLMLAARQISGALGSNDSRRAQDFFAGN